jgi:hypothetical protein
MIYEHVITNAATGEVTVVPFTPEEIAAAEAEANEPPPVVILPRSKRQINAALILSGLTTEPETWMDGILANIPDPVTRALALNDRRNAPYYERSNPLFNDPALLALAGLTVEQVDAMWAAAGGYPE